jgi:hypothetical protein
MPKEPEPRPENPRNSPEQKHARQKANKCSGNNARTYRGNPTPSSLRLDDSRYNTNTNRYHWGDGDVGEVHTTQSANRNIERRDCRLSLSLV